jgi:anti-sigma factor RsiW
MNNQSSLSRAEAEAMLPDYVFGQLTEYEKDVFEASLANYPDLKEEMADMQLVFKYLEKEKYKNMHAQRTRNLSVSVLKRLEQKDLRRKRIIRGASFGIPGLAAAATAFIMMFPGIAPLKVEDADATFGMELASLLSPSEVESIAAEISNEDELFAAQDFTAASLTAELEKIPVSDRENVIAELEREIDASFKNTKSDVEIRQLEEELQQMEGEIQELIQVI